MLPNIRLENLNVDTSTGSVLSIDYAHHEAHAGSSFYYHDVVVLTAAATAEYLLTVPDTAKWPHFGLEVNFNDGAGTTEMYEGADRTGTSAQATFNRDRNSTTVATFTVHKGKSGGTTDGTRILWKRDGTGKTTGGVSGTAVSGATNNVSVVLRWYEHTNKAY